MQLSSPLARVIRHRSLPCLCPGYSHRHRSSCTVAMGRKQPGHHLLCPGPWHLTGSTHVATVTNTFTFLQMKVLSSVQSLSVGDQYRYNNKWNSEHFPGKCFLTCVYECVCVVGCVHAPPGPHHPYTCLLLLFRKKTRPKWQRECVTRQCTFYTNVQTQDFKK